ncbi:MAG: arylamine N-acetyltransferase [Haloarculaceae archaeon]
MDGDRYLRRIGLDPGSVGPRDRETLARLQHAHVLTVPFENLAIAGDPWDRRSGEGVSLDRAALLEKVVERERGGFCYEPNGAFVELLAALGFDATRNAGRIVSDVGMGGPKTRRPVPVDGTAVEDGVGTAWRVVRNERPDVDFTVQYRTPEGDPWADRYVFTLAPRELNYFTATCDYLTAAPESYCRTHVRERAIRCAGLTRHKNPETVIERRHCLCPTVSVFTRSTTVTIGTDAGDVELSGRELHRVEGGEESVRELDRDETLSRTFGIEW